MKKYSILLAGLLFSACVSNQNSPANTNNTIGALDKCPNVTYANAKDLKYLGCELVKSKKGNREVVNLKLTSQTKSQKAYKVKITWEDTNGMTTDAFSERLTTDYLEVSNHDTKNLLYLAPTDDSVNYKVLITGISEIPKGALYDSKHSKIGSNDFSLTTDKLVKQMYYAKVRSDKFLNCGDYPCNLMVERIKNNTRQNFSPKIIKEELVNAINDYQLANYIDSVSGDGSTSNSYAIAKSLEGNEDFDQDKIVQSGHLVGPTHSLRGVITQQTNLETGEVAYYLDVSINRLATGVVEWKGREIINKKF
ncbi:MULTISPECIES: penicillin-binding protein activator LpoB [unclassified Campylobacter]|uniref:penicillin-binding protein activator LpoB n=1 Tax=unclassified Campylobacter TaxID=2593542 RepID=UPI001D95849A|nr:penicillin-binding protein activator LpoB [Campylobacter sp. RM12651]MBZ7991536.1 hypothetical protein [Campylobacter sp. RM9331]MBZ7993370.1 hypothetical protein [Campylobacter sp. RM9333]MBZ8006273.1 hypothetical protein [Campylobacter sp. RM9332]ULO02592.1 hypothetical protein AVBRAN_0099 [Campylobacter sp. RM12651]